MGPNYVQHDQPFQHIHPIQQHSVLQYSNFPMLRPVSMRSLSATEKITTQPFACLRPQMEENVRTLISSRIGGYNIQSLVYISSS